MSLILVLEQETRYIERIHDALTSEGFRVKAVGDHAEALAAAASEAPSLVLVDAGAPGAEALARSFSRRVGGPGVVALLAEGAAASGAAPLGADDQLAKPFTDQDLRLAVSRVVSLRRTAPQVPPAPAAEHKLTSHEIFGDVLAEVEGDLAAPAASGGGGREAPPPAPAPRPAPTAPAARDEIERKLEQTLSGVLGREAKPQPASPTPAARKKAELGDLELDALINKTLSSLEQGTRPRPAAPRPAAPAAPPAPAAAVPAAPPAAAPAPQEKTAVRKPERTGTIDFAELEALARPRRNPEPTRTGTGTPSAPAPPKPAAPAPPVAPAAPIATTQPPAAQPPPPAAPRSVADNPAATQRVPIVASAPAPSSGNRFGQYSLLDKIATGGMAEVWKARMTGVEGFQKTVAIKKILPHMTDNAEFVGMFIDEAKLAAQLSHPNIVHIYDLGKIGHDYYIAMEFVEGKDLRSILNSAARHGRPLPLGLALLIGSRLASALDYAHRKRDFDGREMGLVHRDVSPQNVLITDEGDIKLCDFGIAKAVSKAGQTQMGALKGKLQYMSPEQAWGKAVDARSDIFSLGALLFEMLTGERLFAGTSEMSVLESVREGRIKSPRAVAPAVPERVDAIVLKALSIAPEDRFQTAGELQQELDDVLYSLKPAPGHADLAAYMQQLRDAESGVSAAVPPPAAAPAAAASTPLPPAPVIPELPELPPIAPAADAVATPEAPPAPPVPLAAIPPLGRGEEAGAIDAAPEPTVEPVAPLHEMVVEEGGTRGLGLLVAAILALVVLGALAYLFVLRPRAGSSAAPGEAQEAQAADPAAQAPVPPPAAATVPDGSGIAAPLPAGDAGPAGAAAPGVDVAKLVDQELARRQQELQRQYEERQKRLERELAQAQAAGKAPPATPLPAAAPSTADATPEPAGPAPETAVRAEVPPPVEAAPPPADQERTAPPEPAPAPREPEAPAPQAPRVQVGELVQGGAGVRPPVLVSLPKPQYPPIAKRLQVEGTVVVAVLVDENGRVQEARLDVPIKQNVGINEAALAAARAARYNPATKDGVRVKMWTALRIPFKL